MLQKLIAQADSASFWNQLLSGQVGFILATLVFGAFFWKVMLPRWDRSTKAIETLADAVRLLVVNQMEREGKNNVEILAAVDELGGRFDDSKKTETRR